MKEQVIAAIKDLLEIRSRLDKYADQKRIESVSALLHAMIAEAPIGGVKVSPAPKDDSKPSISFLEWPEVDKREPVRITGTSRGKGLDGQVTIGGLTSAEVDAIAAMTIGTRFVTMRDGRVHAWNVHEQPPSPVVDPVVGPHWEKAPTGEAKLGAWPTGDGWHSPSIYVQHPQSQLAIERLESYGAECLRSRRSDEGQYWEVWMLHAWRLKGALKSHIDKLDDEAKAKSESKKGLDWLAKSLAIGQFIAGSCTVGTIDIVIQRWALSFDD
jgi:hypothetical protein